MKTLILLIMTFFTISATAQQPQREETKKDKITIRFDQEGSTTTEDTQNTETNKTELYQLLKRLGAQLDESKTANTLSIEDSNAKVSYAFSIEADSEEELQEAVELADLREVYPQLQRLALALGESEELKNMLVQLRDSEQMKELLQRMEKFAAQLEEQQSKQ
ncbi:hypothetical protein [Croceiramulus getboli]|nr:hypothetical protein P8624_02770 [Flavobacteriaceae bacterium YJPT1-3]